MAKATANQTLKYNIEDVFKAITDSILSQMKGSKRKNNIVLTNPKVGQKSEYTFTRVNRPIVIFFEIEEYEKPNLFVYSMTVQGKKTYSKWVLEEYAPEVTHVEYTEYTDKNSIFSSLMGLVNRAKFKRTSTGYFVQIDSVLENKIIPEKNNIKVDVDKIALKPEDRVFLKRLTVKELKEVAVKRNVKLPANAKKAEIIDLLLK